ncbi:MAG: anthranilate synthase component I, partial [Gallicola sp.]|nr:anthranilate synthase component I [Gallicola sp.]
AQEDLGRISKEGSIHITELKKIKKYSHVMHIVSHVKSEIKEELNVIDGLIACLQAGTVSGAPKKRALEIIEELENKKRGVYAGAVGYIGFNGNLDMAIAIRTIVFDKNKAYVQAGAGIVEDSQPEKEYYETVSKAQALVEILKTKEALLSQV